MKVYNADIKLLINVSTDLTNNVKYNNTTSFSLLGTLNVQSILNKSCDIVDLITDRPLDILILTETWHHHTSDLSIMRAVSTGYSVLDLPGTQPAVSVNAINYGSLAIINRSTLNLRQKTVTLVPSTFVLLVCASQAFDRSLIYVAIYRPGSSQPNNTFFDELTNLLEAIITLKSNLIIIGDFNIHVDDDGNQHGQHLLDMLDIFGLQHVDWSTLTRGHTLDLIITPKGISISNLSIDLPF